MLVCLQHKVQTKAEIRQMPQLRVILVTANPNSVQFCSGYNAVVLTDSRTVMFSSVYT